MAQDTPTCVVTGGTRGIGKAIALRMSADGYKTLLTYKSDESSAIETTQEIRNLGSECVCIKADLTRPESVDTVVQTALSTLGKIDVLVNNAAISSNENLIADTDPEDWKEMINVNLHSVFDITRKVIPIMRRRGGGNIVNLSSNITKRLAPTFGAYAVSKAGLEALTIILAKEEAPNGIRVNAIAPGPINTKMLQGLLDEMGPEKAKAFLNMVPMKRAGEPEEIASMVAMLVSDVSSYVTGQVIFVNGGPSG
ncbi:MAG: SDR family NAD(P)-dependent oxidoreductase [Gammaproteobacteria bacterium]